MKHLVIGSDLFKPSICGTETVTANMASNLSRMGYRVTVVAPAPEAVTSPRLEHDSDGYDILRVHSFGLPIQKDLRFARRAYGQIQQYLDKPTNKPDIIHVNNPFPTSRALLHYGRKSHIPIVAGSHLMPESFTVGLRKFGDIHLLFDTVGWHWFARFYNKASAVVAPTQTALNYLLDHGLKLPTYAISNGIDLSANRPLKVDKARLKHRFGLKAQYTVIYAGRLGVEKRIDVIIAAISRLCTQFDVQLVLIGDGNALKKLQKQVKRLKLQDRVLFTGFIQDTHARREYLAVSDVFAIASPVELQSIVTLEAMAAGLPVFACREGALPELAKKGKNGGTFADGDAVGLARQIGRVFHDPVRLKQFRQGSLRIVEQHNIADTWRKYDTMYKEVMQKAVPHN